MSELFVSLERVATETDWTVVDVCREWDYEDGHLPGAVQIPFERFRDLGDEIEGKLPTPSSLASLLSESGIEPDDRLVAYDDDFGVYASRFLVTAAVLGHDPERLSVLDGDVQTWTRDHETTTDAPETTAADYTCERADDGPLVGAADLEDALEGDAVVVDTRNSIEYDTVHLPGAINFQWRDLVDEDRRRLIRIIVAVFPVDRTPSCGRSGKDLQ